MPHVTVYATEALLHDREDQLIAHLTEAVVEVYGEWAREAITVLLLGVPDQRWGRGGRADTPPAPVVAFGIREAAFARPDADAIVAGLAAGVTRAIALVCGDEVGRGVEVELVATPPGRTAVGGTLVDD